MARGIKITVTGEDPSDLDFIRERAVAAVEETVEEYGSHFDSNVIVDWEWID